MLAWVCSVIDHRRRQNVVRTSVTHSAIALCATFLFFPHFDVIIPCHTPHETHKDKRDRKSVWASLMKTERPKGPEETPKGGREGERTTRTKKRAKQNDHITLKLTSWPTRGVLGLIKLFP